MHNQPREPQPYEDCQTKSIQEFGGTSQGMDWGWGQGIKSHHTQTCHLATVVIRDVLPGLRRRRTGLLPSGPKSSFQMRASFVFHLETKVLESGGRVEKLIAQVAWSPVLSFHSLWWFGVQCHLLVLVHCVFLNPTSLHPFTKTFWSTSCFLLQTSFLKMLISHRQKHQKLVKWPWCWCVWLANTLTRPEPHRESMSYCQEENEKQETKKCRWAEGHYQRNLGFHTFTFMHLADAFIQTDLQCIQAIHLYCQYVCSLGIEPTTFALLTQCSNHWATGTLRWNIPPQQCHKLITSMPRRIEAVIKAKGAPAKYWVHIQYINILSRRPTIH